MNNCTVANDITLKSSRDIYFWVKCLRHSNNIPIQAQRTYVHLNHNNPVP